MGRSHENCNHLDQHCKNNHYLLIIAEALYNVLLHYLEKDALELFSVMSSTNQLHVPTAGSTSALLRDNSFSIFITTLPIIVPQLFSHYKNSNFVEVYL